MSCLFHFQVSEWLCGYNNLNDNAIDYLDTSTITRITTETVHEHMYTQYGYADVYGDYNNHMYNKNHKNVKQV